MNSARCLVAGCSSEANTFGIVVSREGVPNDVALCARHVATLNMDYSFPDPTRVNPSVLGTAFETCTLHAVILTQVPQQFAFILRSVHNPLFVVMQTGYPESCALISAVKSTPSPVPLTYMLLNNIISGLNGLLHESVIDGFELQGRTYKSHVTIAGPRGIIEVACRGSDAVGIALMARAPIKVDRAYLGPPTSTLLAEPEKWSGLID